MVFLIDLIVTLLNFSNCINYDIKFVDLLTLRDMDLVSSMVTFNLSECVKFYPWCCLKFKGFRHSVKGKIVL